MDYMTSFMDSDRARLDAIEFQIQGLDTATESCSKDVSNYQEWAQARVKEFKDISREITMPRDADLASGMAPAVNVGLSRSS